MITITKYMTAESKLPPYIPYPRFLLAADLTQIAKLLYILLLDRANLSKSNQWTDEQGRIYLVFPIEKLSEAINRSHMTVKTALNELEAAELIERKRQGFSEPNRIYVKLPDGQETIRMTDRKLSPNNLSKNNLSISNMRESKEAPAAFGRYGNVFLLQDEYEELKKEIPGIDRLIDELSGYIKSEGKQYADHAATLRRWYEREKPTKGIPDYTYKEGQSL